MKLRLLLFYVITGLLMAGCAQQIPPTGGPKDVAPPEVVRTVPINQSTNYVGKRIELEFNEYISVENINQQLLITPSLAGLYSVRIRPKGVTITLDSALRPNTTYSLNFRNTFQDATERNPARNVKLVFSTGTTIDSLSVRGQVTDLQTNQPVLDAMVGLYPVSDTLKFSRNKPYYFTRTDSSGNYELENLQAGTYRMAAVVDGNNNLLYDAQKERIGFSEKPIRLESNRTGDDLQIVFVDRTPNRVVTTRPSVNYYTVVYTKGVKQAVVQFLNPSDSIPYMQVDEKQIRFFNTNNAVDTIRTTIQVTDSLDLKFTHPQKIKFRPKGRREEGVRENFQIKTVPADRESVELPLVYKLQFSKPVKTFNADLVRVLGDTTNAAPLTTKNFTWNAYRTELTLQTPVKATEQVRIIFPKLTFLSVENDTNQVIQTNHPLSKPEEYGAISGTVRGAQEGILVELLDAEYRLVRTIRDQVRYDFRLVKPGTYFVRVIDDRNRNGRWDPGDPNLFERPEQILFYPTPIRLKPDFEFTGNDFQLN
ncbi:MAG: Ig-like domain-containing protein [Cytophagaceae bacterium]|nr:Ig-like domain-containing protein [Cytophagaceae bacterium]